MNQSPQPALPRIPQRAINSHKGDFGRALLVGGSRGMSGAIALAGMAALRSGAGLVRLAIPDACLDTVAAMDPSYMTIPLPCDREGRITQQAKDQLKELVAAATCVAVGPGLGRSEGLIEVVGWMYQTMPQPAVFDADALNVLAEHRDALSNPGGARIITPHPGEFLRLVGNQELTDDRLAERAVNLASDNGIVVVLKGHRTLITDGIQQVRNPTGNPGMATGGTGDVLTGLVSALVCQGLPVFHAAQLGVYIHGLAGDLAAEQLGQVSMTARDVVEFLPDAFQEVEEEQREADSQA